MKGSSWSARCSRSSRRRLRTATSNDFSNGFDSIDFSRYSKVKNPQLKRYNFGFAQLLEAKPLETKP